MCWCSQQVDSGREHNYVLYLHPASSPWMYVTMAQKALQLLHSWDRPARVCSCHISNSAPGHGPKCYCLKLWGESAEGRLGRETSVTSLSDVGFCDLHWVEEPAFSMVCFEVQHRLIQTKNTNLKKKYGSSFQTENMPQTVNTSVYSICWNLDPITIYL
jgi:hypothetical protein